MTYKYPFGGEGDESLPGHSTTIEPNGLKAWTRLLSVKSQGTPPRKILQEKVGFFWERGGSWPDQVQLASYSEAALRYIYRHLFQLAKVSYLAGDPIVHRRTSTIFNTSVLNKLLPKNTLFSFHTQ